MPDIESALFAAIGDHKVDGPNSHGINVRLPETMAAYMAALAAQNERSLAEEIRASLRVTIAMSRLAVVLDDDLQKRRRDQSQGILGLTPEAAERYADTLREEVVDEWSKTLPGAHRTFERNFPRFLWGGDPS